MSKYNKKPTFMQHFVNLQKSPLSSNGNGDYAKDHLYWEFDAKPSTFSKVYRVLLIWDYQDVAPKVYILNQALQEISKEKEIPHLYDHKKIQLCLYYPIYREFSRLMSLSETIVAWTYLWLDYYEEWLYSGEWKGGGEHPRIVNREEEKKLSPLKKIQVPNKLKTKKIKKPLIDKVYERRKKLYDKRNTEQ